MNKRIAVVGDNTTTGGVIVTGTQAMGYKGAETALLGDKVFCPKCNSTGSIIEGAQSCLVMGKPAAYDGCIVSCGCTMGTNRIIALKSEMFINV